MSRGKLKFEWSVYSARRKVTLKMLMDKGLAKDYESYVSYCSDMSVIPMPKDKYVAESELLSPVVKPTVITSNEKQPEPEPAAEPAAEPEEPGLEATVWFAGVVDDAAPVTASISTPQKKKKQKEAASDSKE